MTSGLKRWWRTRHAKHYLNNYWHLIADIVLVSFVLELLIALIAIHLYSIPQIDTSVVKHIPKDNITDATSAPLIVKTEITKSNIYLGRAVELKINLENNSQNPINNLALSFRLNNNFAVSKIENNATSTNVKIIGDKIVLENLASGENRDISIMVTLSGSSALREINWFLRTSYQESGKDHLNDYLLTNLKLITNLKVKATAYYNSPLGDQLGSGPIPPVVGLPTNYWVFFEVDNEGNDLSGLAVSAKLAEGVTLSNNKTLSAGEFTYNEGQKRLTWLVKEAKVKNGLYQIGFEVQLTPSAKQIDTEPLLVSNISYLATDAYTGEKLSGKLPQVNTELPLDTINQSQGKVTAK